jgi:structural maintenance of chromosome 1
MTGGRSTHNTGKKWDEKDIQGRTTLSFIYRFVTIFFSGLHRVRDALMAQLHELNKSKPRGKADENLIAEISRLESSIAVTRDDLVGSNILFYGSLIVYGVAPIAERMQTSLDWNQR